MVFITQPVTVDEICGAEEKMDVRVNLTERLQDHVENRINAIANNSRTSYCFS